jgi:Zn-dependent peptidase ImmA (M78 family)/DNA-binding XRE family transcriptional regulator
LLQVFIFHFNLEQSFGTKVDQHYKIIWLTNIQKIVNMSTKWLNYHKRRGNDKMIENFGRRLKSARKMAGLSMERLAVKANNVVTKQAINKYEKGLMNPNSSVVISLSNALDIKPDYFFRPSAVLLSNLEFRKKSKLGAKEKDKVKFRTLDFLERYLEIEEILNLNIPFENPLSNICVNDHNDTENAAAELRERWNLGDAPISNLMELLEDKGVRIYEIEIGDDFHGLSARADDIPVITVRQQDDLLRKRFTIAHELGHLLLNTQNVDRKTKEKLCHSFAGAFLLPEKVIRAELGDYRRNISLWELKKLKGIYGISMQAVMARANNLNIISENTYREFCIFMNKKGWKKDEPGEYRRKEHANRFKQLVFHAAAEQIITLSKAAELLNVSLAEIETELEIVS